MMLFGCSLKGEDTAGTSIETTNGIAGVITDPDSNRVVNATVTVRTAGYLPQATVTAKIAYSRYNTTTNSEGYFEVDSLLPGEYTVEVASATELGAKFDVVLDTLTGIVNVEKQIDVPGIVKGVVDLQRVSLNESKVWVQVYGMERLVSVDTNGLFAMSVPAGEYRMRVVGNVSGASPIEIAPITISVGDTITIDTVSVEEWPIALISSEAILESSELSSEISSSSMSSTLGVSSSNTALSSSIEVVVVEPITPVLHQYSVIDLDGVYSVPLHDTTAQFNPGAGNYTVSFNYTRKGSGLQYLVTKGNTLSGDEGWNFFLEDEFLNWRLNAMGDPDQKAGMHVSLESIPEGVTVRIAGVIDRELGQMRGYVNGSDAGWIAGTSTSMHNGIVGFGEIVNDARVIVGGSWEKDPEFDQGILTGSISDLRIYKHALTQEQIVQFDSN